MTFISKWWSFKTAMTRGNLQKGAAGDGREKAVLNFVLENADKNPESVLKAIDQFAQKSWLMTVGSDKGSVLEKAVIDAKAKNALELGGYVGYSATLIGSKLSDGCRLISVEKSPENVDITSQVVNHAGLSEKVVVLEGILADKVKEIKEMLQERGAQTFDVVFIDHHNSCYLPDFLILKEEGLIEKGSVLVADNMITPGAPHYRKYMDDHAEEYDTVEHKKKVQLMGSDSVFVSTCK